MDKKTSHAAFISGLAKGFDRAAGALYRRSHSYNTAHEMAAK
jgi:hypothetical protein